MGLVRDERLLPNRMSASNRPLAVARDFPIDRRVQIADRSFAGVAMKWENRRKRSSEYALGNGATDRQLSKSAAIDSQPMHDALRLRGRSRALSSPRELTTSEGVGGDCTGPVQTPKPPDGRADCLTP